MGQPLLGDGHDVLVCSSPAPGVASHALRGITLREPVTASDPESLFLASLPTIDRLVAIIGRRHGLSGADTEEFGSWVRERLIETQYAVFRKFAGRSSLQTYLSAVVANLFRDFRNTRWGRWRPSTLAKRLGPLAIQLETLLYRDGHPAREAIALLKARGADEGELRSLLTRIPSRIATREVGLDSLGSSIGEEARAIDPGPQQEHENERREAEAAVQTAMAVLSPEDRIILRLRFWDGCSIADIARSLGLEQKPLYRRLEGIKERLALALRERGFDRERAVAALADQGLG